MKTVVDTVARFVLGLPAWVALLVVFALPGLESSAFVGFVFPGEVALILGGVLAEQGRVPLAAVLAAGFLGAVVGDSVGYAVGRRYGRPVLDGTLGRLVKRDHVDRAERYLAERGGRAVFLGRFTAALRVMIPGMAGMAGLRYRVFLAYNVAGAAGWVTLSVLLGYLGGSSWKHVEHIASRVGLGVLGLIVVLGLAGMALRKGRTGPLQRLARGLLGHRWTLRARRRFPRAFAWTVHRLDARRRTGLPVTATVGVLATALWTFAGTTQDVVAHEGLAVADPRVHAWVLAHRTRPLDVVFRLVTHLGSNVVIVPVLVLAVAWLSWRWRSLLPVVAAVLVYGAAVMLHAMVALWVHRPRPAAADWLAPAAGWSYPSGHTTQACAAWGLLALLLCLRARPRAKVVAISAAATVAVLVAASRVYLGVHWLTDVLGGATLSAALLALAVLTWLLVLGPDGVDDPDLDDPGQAATPADAGADGA